MKIKRFTGPTMRDVMRQVQETLGPDAVILETGRGPDGVELSAAMDYDPAVGQPAPARPAAAPRLDVTDEDWDQPAVARETGDAALATASGTELAQMREEMRSIRSLLEAQLSRLVWDEAERRTPEVAGIMRNLSQLGLTPDIVARLVQDPAATRDLKNAWTASLKQLVDHIGVCDEDLVCEGGVFAVVGPTGVGKTTTIAKLAARYARHGDVADIALVTTDTYRIGAREQLETFGRLLQVPVYQAGSAAALAATLRSLADKRLVLIDTAGLSQRDVRLTQALACLGAAGANIRVLLALPATAQTDSMQEIVDAFRIAQPAACILTKIDEATSLGGRSRC